MHDISYDRAELASMRHKLLELEQAVRVRDEFIATIAHELRNPLTPLIFQARAAIDRTAAMASPTESISSEWVETQFRRFEKNLHRVLAILDRVLDASQLSTGRIDLQLEVVDFGSVVQAVTASFEAELSVAQCELRYTQRGDVTGLWDHVRLEQVCRNLISNAIRYGAGAPIDVSVTGDARTATLTVRDHGIGISAEHQQRIFERFERVSGDIPRHGFGIGLWVVKSLCAAMGGTIAVASDVGQGAQFTVVLPRRLEQPARPVEE